ncbi:MAG TPA: SWIM zinc finger family protein [Anaerolineae bacterium]|nr:SWIM zinc finger family protein [Anaerolineae bacterium]
MAKKPAATKSGRKSVKADPPIGEASIKRKTDAQVFERGEDYFDSGAVIRPIRIGNTLIARCHGSGAAPYRVRITFGKQGVSGAECDCPYDWGGYCKHIVALLLTHIRAPGSIEVKPTVQELLAESDRDELITMIEELVGHSPELYGIVDGSGLPEAEDGEYDDDEW